MKLVAANSSVTGESHPAVKGRGPFLTAAAGLDAEGVSHALDNITKPNFLLDEKPWQTHAVRPRQWPLLFWLGCRLFAHVPPW
jgi:hypothetical protein